MSLYLIVGASGAGKKIIVSKLKSLLLDCTEIKKLTTRIQPENEQLKKADLIYNIQEEIIRNRCADLCYTIEEDGEACLYGIDENDITCALANGSNPILIVRDYKILNTLVKRYPQAILIKVTTGITDQDLSEALMKNNSLDMDVAKRYNKDRTEYINGIKYSGIIKYNGYLENNFDNTINPQLQKILFTIKENQFFKIFVACQFSNDDENHYISSLIENTIQQVKERFTNYLQRELGYSNQSLQISIAKDADENNKGSYSIIERIFRDIDEAEYVICDLSVNNGNVFYEYEYALQHNKKVITIAKIGSYGTKVAPIDIEYSNYDLPNKLLNELKRRYNIPPKK